MSAQHTPGPWTTNPTGPVMHSYTQPWGVMNTEAGQLIAGCFGDVRGGAAQSEANARLIAAAPDLLAVAKTLLTWAETFKRAIPNSLDEGPLATDIVKARAVIARAKGATS